MADMAPRAWGIPVVASTAERDTLFASPATNRRVQNLETGRIERWTGTSWVADVTPVVSPLGFGAVGDAVTDDSAAVQAALDFAGSLAAIAGTARVELSAMHLVSPQAMIGGGPSGSYCVKVPSGVTLVGNGASTGLKSTTNGATIVLIQGTSNTSHVTKAGLRSLAIVGGDSTANGIGRGVYLMRADYCSVVDCDISGTIIGVQCDVPGGDTNRNLAPVIANNRVHDTYWSGSLQTGSGSGIFVALSTGARVVGNSCWNIAEHCVYVCDDTRDLAIIGNDLRPLNASNQNCCIQIFTSETVPNIDRLTVTGNTCVGGKWGILLSTTNSKITQATIGQNTVTGQTTIGITCANVTDLSIVGNQVSLVSAGDGIEVSGGTRVAVVGNGVRACGTSGIILFGTTYSTVMGNTACNNDQVGSTNYGIRIALASTHCRVIGNVATDDQGSPTQKYGIQADSDCDFIYVAGNTVRGNVTAQLAIAATNAVVKDNDGWNPVGQSAPSLTSSPMTYTNGSSPATLYVKGATVSSIVSGGVTLATATDASIPLAPNQAVVITYSGTPTLAVDVQ